MNDNNLKNLTNRRFGRLLVVNRADHNSKSGNAMWVCQCDCGNSVTVIGSKLGSGHTKSCGCLRFSEMSKGCSKERIYRTWKGMHQRCYNQKHDKYKWYGGKGVRVCNNWHDFTTFRNWALANGYTDKLTIDRINPDIGYRPDNCRWVDMKTQANNKTNNHIIEFNGTAYTVTQLADKVGFHPYTIFNRLKLGWSAVRIVETAERSRCSNESIGKE